LVLQRKDPGSIPGYTSSFFLTFHHFLGISSVKISVYTLWIVWHSKRGLRSIYHPLLLSYSFIINPPLEPSESVRRPIRDEFTNLNLCNQHELMRFVIQRVDTIFLRSRYIFGKVNNFFCEVDTIFSRVNIFFREVDTIFDESKRKCCFEF
jgi:hypothetical protein